MPPYRRANMQCEVHPQVASRIRVNSLRTISPIDPPQAATYAEIRMRQIFER